VIFAHQGGWDEMLMVLVPIGLFIGLLRLAKRRAERAAAEPAGSTAEDDESPEAE
jgi:hypothetical protein